MELVQQEPCVLSELPDPSSSDPESRESSQREADAPILLGRNGSGGRSVSSLADLEGSAAADKQIAHIVQAAGKQVPGGLDAWLESWCTPQVVAIYSRAAKGNHSESARLLAVALCWRHEHRALLRGEQEPRWQGDMRLVARGDGGHPVILMSMRHQPARINSTHSAEHMAVVLEAAVQEATRNGVVGFDVVCDCRGFQLAKNLDPRPTVAAAEILKHAFRGRFRTGFIVDAPGAFSFLWRIASKAMPQSTVNKIRFVSVNEAAAAVALASGEEAGAIVARHLAAPTAPNGTSPWKLPSELSH
ncbi:unnamed protein product [Polarella glacialis]|uniref:CRAL-TRIO domain-containing protein n=2 Tax=Polarella glacialis TaxID=89957 RepID=A0A813KJ77_POLGL|nr:unnamed protein product [Polarella glacialis]